MKRFLLLLLIVCAAAKATPTEIRDTIFTGFSGVLFAGRMTIDSPAMTTADGRTVQRWQRTYTVVGGVISVDLEPNSTATPAGTSYSVVYRPTSGLAWSERWVVTASASPLTVSDVRVVTAPIPTVMFQPSQILGGGASIGQCIGWSGSSWAPINCQSPISGAPSTWPTAAVQESDVTGLVVDLAARPLKAPGYANGRAAMVDSTGALDAVIGAPSDCVRVDGSSGPCGATQVNSDWNASSGVAQVLNKPAAFPPTRHTLIFDGSTTNPGDGSTLTWTCGFVPGTGITCTTIWTVPAGVTAVNVEAWSGGAGGQGSTAGVGGGAGGGGGGYYQTVCPTIPGAGATVMVGPGGLGGTAKVYGNPTGGSSGFGSCFTLLGAGGFAGGGLSGLSMDPTGGTCYGYVDNLHSSSTVGRPDLGACCSGERTVEGNGDSGGSAPMGGAAGGGGTYNSTHIGMGGTSGRGGAGGNGGEWVSGSAVLACTAGAVPGGGGGGAWVATAGYANGTGCNGARGEVRVYY